MLTEGFISLDYEREVTFPYMERTFPERQSLIEKIWLVIKIILAVIFIIPFSIYTCVRFILLMPLYRRNDVSMARSFLDFVLSSFGFSKKTTITLKNMRRDGRSWIGKRQCLHSGAQKIDTFIIGTRETINNGRWIVFSNGSLPSGYRECLRHSLSDSNQGYRLSSESSFGLLDLADSLEANIICYDYPFYGDSSGFISSLIDSTAKSHKLVLDFTENQERGLGAKQIISFGYSLGGMIQLKSLVDRPISANTSYVVLSSRVPSSLTDVFSCRYGRGSCYPIIRLCVKIILWLFRMESDAVKNATLIQYPHIIYGTYDPNFDDARCYGDNAIHGQAALGYRLSYDGNSDTAPRIFIGSANVSHNILLSQRLPIEEAIKHYLSQQSEIGSSES